LNFNAQVDFNASERRKIAEAGTQGNMPPASYLWLHPGARLQAADLAILRDWAAGKLDSK
ncbi:MAG: heme-binding domain-containing protein, partial [Bryobacterales bacterium]|nr:heme-binding domain-containing protein [Bryobacterales bacterium]